MPPADEFGKVIFVSLLSGLWNGFKMLWWFWPPVLLIWLVSEFGPVIRKRILRERKFASIDGLRSGREILNKLKRLTPTEFEDYVARLYFKLGYNTERVGQSHDGGIDVIAEKDGVKHYIQCKKYVGHKVPVGAVRDFYGAITSKLANGNGIFITTNFFTTEAGKFAEDNMVDSVNGYELLELIKASGIDNSSLFIKTSGAEIENCPVCGAKLKLKNGKYGKFYGCSNYPKCEFTKSIK